MLNRLMLFTVFFAIASCVKKKEIDPSLSPFSQAVSMGELSNDEIKEASGLEASVKNPGALWTHNDSGDTSRIFLIHENGVDIKTFYLDGVRNRDWEEMTLGPGPDEDKSYLYVAEIGDNEAVHEFYYIYRFEEPAEQDESLITAIDVIRFQYPDGNRDAECLMIDPLTKDLYIISKREDNVHLYRMAYPQSTSTTIIPVKLGTLPFHKIIAGDISTDGKEVILKTYDEILYWKRASDERIEALLLTSPINIPYEREPQGEAMAWRNDQTGFYTLSEEPGRKEAEVYYYQRK